MRSTVFAPSLLLVSFIGFAATSCGEVVPADPGQPLPVSPTPVTPPGPAEPTAPEEAEEPGSTALAQAALESFFSLERIHAVEIELGSEALAKLAGEPKSYVPATVSIDDVQLATVGVRLKGNAGSFVALDGDYPEVSQDGNGNPGKSGFIIDFNRFEKKTRFLGLEKLTVNNLVQDPSCVHEMLGYALFREGGVPASRVGYAIVSLGGVEKGLYALIESTDNDEMLKKWFGTKKGNLYEGEYGADIDAERYETFDQDNGKDETKSDLAALVAALDAIEDAEDPLPVLSQHVDMDTYLTFAATEVYLGHWDGYVQSTNNFKIHHDPETGLWTLMPWGMDQLFVDGMGPYSGVIGGAGFSWPHGGRIHRLCMRSAQCRKSLHQAYEDVIERAWTMDLAGLAKKARALVEPQALAEAKAHGDPLKTVEYLDNVAKWLTERPTELGKWMPCLSGGQVDDDGDGYDGCTVDCDDHDPQTNPGALEECNLRDDDCNGQIDDGSECPSCQTVDGPEGKQFEVCVEKRSWQAARTDCQERGGELASLHDELDWELSTFPAMAVAGEEGVWIGLSDTLVEGDFFWSDGTPVDFEHWGPESPKSAEHGEPRDCVLSNPEGWRDVPCDRELAYVCRLP